jgi:hypothetical protein
METDDRFRALKLLADHPEGCTEACHPPGYFAHDAWFRCRAMREALLEAVQAPVKCSLNWIPTSGLASTFARRPLRAAGHKGVRTLVDAVQLDQVKGIEDHLIIVGAAVQPSAIISKNEKRCWTIPQETALWPPGLSGSPSPRARHVRSTPDCFRICALR